MLLSTASATLDISNGALTGYPLLLQFYINSGFGTQQFLLTQKKPLVDEDFNFDNSPEVIFTNKFDDYDPPSQCK